MQSLVVSGSSVSIKRPLIEVTVKFYNVRVGIAIGLNGLLVVAQRGGQRWLIAVGRWGRIR
jgi:hypothetical protein